MRRLFALLSLSLSISFLVGCGGGGATDGTAQNDDAAGGDMMGGDMMGGDAMGGDAMGGMPGEEDGMEGGPDGADAMGGELDGADGYPDGGDAGPPGGEGDYGPPGGEGDYPDGGDDFPPGGEGDFPPGGEGGFPPGGEGDFPPGGEGDFPPGGEFPGGEGGIPGPGGEGGGPGGEGGGPYGGTGGRPPARPKIENFKEAAEQAFREGKNGDAMQYLYAHALTDDVAGRNVKVRWVKGIGRPTYAVRFGYGVYYHPHSSFRGVPPRLGDPLPPRGNGRGGRGNPRGGGFEGGPGGGFEGPGIGGPGGGFEGPGGGGIGGDGGFAGGQGGQGGGGRGGTSLKQTFELLTGQLGERILAGMETNRRRGSYGEVVMSSPMPQERGGPLGGGGGGIGGGPGGFGGEPDGPGGFGGEPGGPGDFGPGGPGDFGPGGPGDFGPGDPGGGGPGGPQGGGGTAQGGFETDSQGLTPVINMLGVARVDELLDRAADESLDVLVLFDVRAFYTSKGEATNTSKVAVYDVARKVKLFETGDVNNLKIHFAKKNRRPDPLETAVKVFFEKADAEVSQTAFDKFDGISGTSAQRRVNLLAAARLDNPLPTLVEVRYYQAQDKIAPDAYIAAAKTLLGGESGERLMGEKQRDRIAAVMPYLPREFEGFGDDRPGDGPRGGGDDRPPQGPISFSRHVAPILVAKCARCHIEDAKGGVSMTSYAALMRGSRKGKIVISGDADRSPLVTFVASGKMPKGGGKVSAGELATLKKWVTDGARFDGSNVNASLSSLGAKADGGRDSRGEGRPGGRPPRDGGYGRPPGDPAGEGGYGPGPGDPGVGPPLEGGPGGAFPPPGDPVSSGAGGAAAPR